MKGIQLFPRSSGVDVWGFGWLFDKMPSSIKMDFLLSPCTCPWGRRKEKGGLATPGGASISKLGAAGWIWDGRTWWAGAQTPLWGRQPSWVWGGGGGAWHRRFSSTENIRGTSSSGTRPPGPPLPAMCGPRRCRRGPGGDFVAGGFGGRPGSSAAPAPGALRSWPHSCGRTDENIPGQGSRRGCRWGAPRYAHPPPEPPRLGLCPSACRGAGNAAGAPPAAGVELRPQNIPPGADLCGWQLPHLLPPHHSILGGSEWC